MGILSNISDDRADRPSYARYKWNLKIWSYNPTYGITWSKGRFYLAKTTADYPEINRHITTYEYEKVVELAIELGLTEGYMQKKSSAKEEYTPSFDLEGVIEPEIVKALSD